jgi:putative membrane protein
MAVFPVACALAIALGCNTNTSRNEENNEALDNTPAREDTVGTVGADNNREFLTKAMDANMAEIELGRMAQEKAAGADVKRFAQMMVADHGKALDELKPIANRQGTPMVAQLDDKHRDLRDRLSRLSGAEFDREYMQAMVAGHEDVVDLLQTRANEDRFGENKGTTTPERTDDAMAREINQWAAKALPTTRHHLEEARRVNDGLGSRQTRN